MPSDRAGKVDALTAVTVAAVRRVEIEVCDLCLSGAGGECHVPGCAFWMTSACDATTAEVLNEWRTDEA